MSVSSATLRGDAKRSVSMLKLARRAVMISTGSVRTTFGSTTFHVFRASLLPPRLAGAVCAPLCLQSEAARVPSNTSGPPPPALRPLRISTACGCRGAAVVLAPLRCEHAGCTRLN